MRDNLPLKDKLFVEYFALSKDVVVAYHKAGFDPNRTASNVRVKATLKLQQPKIQEYLKVVEEGKRKLKHFEITQERIMEMLIDDREFAISCKSPAAASGATKLLGQAIGMFKNTAELVNNNISIGSKGITKEDAEILKTLSKEEIDNLISLGVTD